MNGSQKRGIVRLAAMSIALCMLLLAAGALFAGCSTAPEQPANVVEPAQSAAAEPDAVESVVEEPDAVQQPDEQQWDMAADVVVVGGGTGQFAAIAAAAKGMKVILLEKRPVVGGAMAFSGGNAWLANTEYSIAMGDSYEKAKTYLDHMQMGYGRDEIVEAYLNNTQAVVDVCKEVGIGLQPLPRGGEYQSGWEGAQNEGGRSCQVLGTNVDGSDISEAGGQRMNQAMIKACEELGVEVFTKTAGRRLITYRETDDAVPEVIGIVAEDADGNELRIKANRGVILATGGFEWNEEYVKNYLRVPMPIGAAISWPENTGDAIPMALSVGADLVMMNQMFGMPVFTAHAEYARENKAMASGAGNAARFSQGTIIVDANGRRFVQEDVSYMSVVNAFGGFNNFGDHAYTADPAWWICDQASYDAQGGPTGVVRSWGYPDPGLPEEDYVYKADTPHELAELIGINADQFVATLEEYNKYAAEGKDPLFHRGEAGEYASLETVPVVPIETGPYYAVAISAGVVGTIGGPKLNGNAQVMHVSGVPVEGLYAMGNCAGVGGPGPSYGGEGGTIGPALTFGVIAAHHAAARTDVTDSDFFINARPNEGTFAASETELAENEFVGVGMGINGEVVVKVTVEDGKTAKVEVVSHNETAGIGERAVAQLPEAIIAAQSTEVDTVSGATVTSEAILAAVNDALQQAGLQ